MENEVKEPAPKYDYISPQEYLAIDRASDLKNEYYDGQIYPMANGASLPHNSIEVNIMINIGSFLEGKKCRILSSSIRTGTPTHDSYMYPDASIVCGEPVLGDHYFNTLLNPSVIFEILSPSTRSIDKGRKFEFCKQIPVLREYIMIDSEKRSIQVYRKQAGDQWKLEELNEHAETLHIQTIDFLLAFSKIYSNTGL